MLAGVFAAGACLGASLCRGGGGDELDLEQYKPGAAPLVVALSAEQIETEIGLLLCMHRVLGTSKAKSQPMLMLDV